VVQLRIFEVIRAIEPEKRAYHKRGGVVMNSHSLYNREEDLHTYLHVLLFNELVLKFSKQVKSKPIFRGGEGR
jgi:hypothetical protein